MINNNDKGFNVKTIPQTTQVDFAKRSDQRLAPCGIIPEANHTF